jgi:uncharacterized protein YraI
MKRITILPLLMSLLAMPAWALETGSAIKDDKLLASPSATAKQVGALAKGEAVTIVSSSSGWLQVKGRAGQGWVRLLSIRKGATGSGSASAADVVALTQGRAGSGQVVATAGIRGLDEEDLRGAKFNAREIEKLEGFAVSRAQAEQFAQKSQLAPRPVAFLPDPTAQQPTPDSGSGSRWGE